MTQVKHSINGDWFLRKNAKNTVLYLMSFLILYSPNYNYVLKMFSLSRSIIMILPSKFARPIYVFKLRHMVFNQLLIRKIVLFFFFALKSKKKVTARNVREIVLTLQAAYQRFIAALQRVQNYTILIYNTPV